MANTSSEAVNASESTQWRDPAAKRDRFLRFNGPDRLGNLASTLLRTAQSAKLEERFSMVLRSLDEARLFLVWDETPRDAATVNALNLIRMSIEDLEARWQALNELDATLAAEVAAKCRAYSDEVLALSGLLDE